MRLTHLAIALLTASGLAAPAFAQPATAPTVSPTGRPVAPIAPATPPTRPMPSTPSTAPITAPTTASPTTATTTMAAPAVPPATPRRAPTAATAATTGPVNINTASTVDLDKLPQIGKARAASIVNHRPYKTTDELVSKKAISQGVYEKIKDRITAG